MSFTTRLAVIIGVLIFGLVGWGLAGYVGAGIGLTLGLVLFAIPWRRQPLWSWAALYARRNRPIVLSEPVTVANDRSGGGVRYQEGVAIVAVQLLGKAHAPTLFTGSTSTKTRNTIDLREVLPVMHQSLGLTVESLSVVSMGSRRRSTGDYPRVYDTLIGTPPYAGQRETWLVVRLRALDNADALRWRATVGTAALAVAQRIVAALRCKGIRAKVATATDIVELERRLGRTALESHNQRWRTVRSDAGWLTTYAYRPQDVTTDVLGQVARDGITESECGPTASSRTSRCTPTEALPRRSPYAVHSHQPRRQASCCARCRASRPVPSLPACAECDRICGAFGAATWPPPW